MIYKAETHDYSYRNEIKQWFKESKIDATVDKNGYTYRFYREADRTMFLLRWA